MIVIKAIDLRKTYPCKPPVEALRKFSIEINEGECVALLGPNGAGKTTFLKILTGILLSDSGSITIYGKDPATSPTEIAKYLRYLPENPFLLRNNTLWENASFWFQYWNEELPRDTLQLLFEKFQLGDRTDEPVSRYSRGMLQKSVLSFMLATKARIIVLDEPTLGLDVVSVKEVVEMINELKKEQKTIIIASQAMTFVEDVAQKVILINLGQALEVESVEIFIEKYGRPRYIVKYKHGQNEINQTFIDYKEWQERVRTLLTNDNIEIIEFMRTRDSLDQILQRLLKKEGIK